MSYWTHVVCGAQFKSPIDLIEHEKDKDNCIKHLNESLDKLRAFAKRATPLIYRVGKKNTRCLMCDSVWPNNTTYSLKAHKTGCLASELNIRPPIVRNVPQVFGY